MLNNFHIAALTKIRNRIQLFHIPLQQSLQDMLAEMWSRQYEDFMAEIKEIDFDAGYTPEEHERFRLVNYQLPEELSSVNSLTVESLEQISNHEDCMESIRAIVGFARDQDGNELILFQKFYRSNVIRPGHFLFLQNNTYKSVQRPGLSLDNKLSAIYITKNNKLLFQNFRATGTFLPLVEFYQEASDHEIQSILNHKMLAPENASALVAGANQWSRKRFSMLKASGILDKYTAQQIANHSESYEINIHLDGDKIVFPAEKTAAKKLLQFLNEEIFRGAITETLYETNSKRAAD